MGIVKVGIKIFSPIVEKWVEKSGVKSVIQTNKTIFHGINPTLTYTKSGKSFILPRFCSEEMKQARQMNKIAARQLRNPTEFSFPKANNKDFARLTDNSFEACNLRTTYTNPENGEVYHLLSEGKTKDGLSIIRILDKDGAFVKTAKIKPKKVIIIDDFTSANAKKLQGTNSTQLVDKTHGDLVQLSAQRANPFVEYECIDMFKDIHTHPYSNLYDVLEKIQERINSGEKIDFISLSIGRGSTKEFLEKQLNAINISSLEAKTTNILNSNDIYDVFPLAEFARRNSGKVRVIESAGNWGKNKINADLTYPYIEGVGALMPEVRGFSKVYPGGKIAGISASRNSLYTQHYEQGFFRYVPTKNGLSIFDGKTTDIPIKEESKKILSKYLGKEPNVISMEEKRHIEKVKQAAYCAKSQKYKELRSELVTQEEENQLKKLKRSANAVLRTKSRTPEQEEYNALKIQLDNRVKEQMKNYSNEYEIQYKQAIENLIKENKLMTNGLGDYYIPNTNPYSFGWQIELQKNNTGVLQIACPHTDSGALMGTSFSTPIRTAKLALNDMMKEVL